MVHTIPLRPSYLLCLPPELLAHILGYLPVPALLRVSVTSRALHALVAHSLWLQYTIELFADGLAAPPSTQPARARLRALLRRRARWRALAHTAVVRVPLGGPCSAYELVGGVFAKAARGHYPAFAAVHLPTAARLGWTDEHASVGPDVDARDFAIDPSQDFLALVELVDETPAVRIHLRMLSTLERHPEAKDPLLVHETGTLVESAVCQVADDALAFFWISDVAPGLVIWNWRTGQKFVEHIGPLKPSDGWDFDFVSPRAYVLASCRDAGHLDLFTFGPLSPLPHSPGGTFQQRTGTHAARLRLPLLQPGVSLTRCTVHSGPFEAHGRPGGPPPPLHAECVHVLSTNYVGTEDAPPRRFSVFFKRRTLLSYTERTHGSLARSTPVDVPWEAWGPRNTRVMPQYQPFGWLRYVHGARVVLPPLVVQDGHHTEHVLRLLDFSVRPGRIEPEYDFGDSDNDDECGDSRSRRSGTPAAPAAGDKSNPMPHMFFGTPQPGSGVLSGASATAPGLAGTARMTMLVGTTTEDTECAVFRAPVASSLPCAVLERQARAYRYTAFMLDAERVIGLNTTPFTAGDMRDVDVFAF